MTLKIHGIKSCDTMKKAFTWLKAHGVEAHFHDYKAKGADPVSLRAWVDALGWESVLNRSGTTFRGLPEDRKADLDADKAVAIMLEFPSSIRRPILDGLDGPPLAGFKPDIWAARLGVAP